MLRDCAHEKTEVRKFTMSNGTVAYKSQCASCGAGVGNWIPKAKVKFPVLSWDYSKQEEQDKQYAEARKQAERDRLESNQQWWADYSRYLLSPAWAHKRMQVLKRDHYTCQACLSRTANEVHHKTYDHLFDEPLFDLEAVCGQCHDKITAMDRERRGGGPTKLTVEDFGLPVQEEVEASHD